MGIETLFTVQSGLTQAKPAGGKAAGDSSVASLNFLDLILTRLNDINAKKDISSSVTSDTPTPVKTENTFSIEDLLAAHPDMEQNIQNFMAANPSIEASTQLTTTVDGAQKPGLSLLQILQISPDGANAEIASQIKALRDKIQAMLEKGDTAVLTTNLTPEQITALQNAQDGQWPDELKGVGVIIIALIQPQDQTPVPGAVDLSNDPTLANALAILAPTPQQLKAQADAAAASLEAVLPEAEEAISSKLNSLTPGTGDDAENPFGFEDFETTLKSAQDALKSGKNNSAETLSNNNAKPDAKNPQVAGPGFSALQGWSGAISGGLFTAAHDGSGLYNDLGLAALSAQPLHSGMPGSLITQSASATLPHPATQAIAVNIQKAANGGQSRTISMELDPPELGRIEVKLTFAKDKTMKAHVIAEKPETYMMLQRDSDTLQRALEASGLEGDAGLSFELAQQGFDFGQNNQRGGGHDAGGTGTGAENIETIESTMTWHVDPNSGHMRYDIYA